MQCCQWKSKKFLLDPALLTTVLKSRRVVKALKNLIPLFGKDLEIKTTYNELATHLGYDNRSGSFKAIKQLESLGIVKYNNGYLRLTMEGILLTDDE